MKEESVKVFEGLQIPPMHPEPTEIQKRISSRCSLSDCTSVEWITCHDCLYNPTHIESLKRYESSPQTA